jgi:D-lyxose ketol-isomerase
MKRSEVNSIISHAKNFFSLNHFLLPEWAFWPPTAWQGMYERCSEIVENKLGWDITDFGSGDFSKKGLALFTIRNGNWIKNDKPYCEKIMVSLEGQVTPMHFHWKKTEDIINRGGGNLVMELYGSNPDSMPDEGNIHVSIDGLLTEVKAGEKVILRPGQSICLKPGLYHRFYGEEGNGTVLIGEVSMVNDDSADNKFYDPVGRFPEIVEDEEPIHLLVNDYSRYL